MLFLENRAWDDVLERTDAAMFVFFADLTLVRLFGLELDLSRRSFLLHFEIGCGVFFHWRVSNNDERLENIKG